MCRISRIDYVIEMAHTLRNIWIVSGILSWRNRLYNNAGILMRLIPILSIIFLLFSPGKLNAQDSSCTSERCHGGFGKMKFVHAPVAGNMCESCHQLKKETTHPSKRKKDFTLTAEGAALCHMCHEKKDKGRIIHGAIKMGGCTVCHDPHQSEHKFQLISEPGKALCGTCHSDKVEKKSFPHPPAAEGNCTLCHTPHSSDTARLLLLEDPKICFSCHPDQEEAVNKRKTVHAPVTMGCANCHNPHGAKLPKLLVSAFPDTIYVEFSRERFALCFSCHDDGLVMKEKTTDATGFRQKERNLHALHVKRDKGRVCILCHDVHASNSTHLIRDFAKFGQWRLPIGFQEKEKGGTCAPGCHRKVEYER